MADELAKVIADAIYARNGFLGGMTPEDIAAAVASRAPPWRDGRAADQEQQQDDQQDDADGAHDGGASPSRAV